MIKIGTLTLALNIVNFIFVLIKYIKIQVFLFFRLNLNISQEKQMDFFFTMDLKYLK